MYWLSDQRSMASAIATWSAQAIIVRVLIVWADRIRFYGGRGRNGGMCCFERFGQGNLFRTGILTKTSRSDRDDNHYQAERNQFMQDSVFHDSEFCLDVP